MIRIETVPECETIRMDSKGTEKRLEYYREYLEGAGEESMEETESEPEREAGGTSQK